MRSFIYCLETAVKNLLREKWINILTILTIAVGLIMLSTFVLITLNMDSAIKRWSKGFGLVVYMNESVNKDDEQLLSDYFHNDSDVINVTYISKEAALKELEKTLGASSSILAGFKENPLQSSFELKLKKEILSPVKIKQKVNQIEQLNGVEDVQYGENWLDSLNTMTRGMKIITLFVGSIISIAVAFATYSTIKILFYRRIDEIETLKLLGAKRSFIRLPFLIEGVFVGLSGGIISLFSLLVIYSLSTAKIINFIPSLKGIIVFLPVETYPAIPFAGALMSLIGSFIAIGKIRY